MTPIAPTAPDPTSVTGVVLAGGRGVRMGGRDKGLVDLAGQPMVRWVMEKLSRQVDTLIISANRHADAYASFGAPVVSDTQPDFAGPLAGIAAALSASTTPWVLTVPCDCPQLPGDLLQRLAQARQTQGGRLAIAQVERRPQPVFALVHQSLLPDLEAFLNAGERKAWIWCQRHRPSLADFSDCPEAFANINTPREHRFLAATLQSSPSPEMPSPLEDRAS
ncbi:MULTISPECIES: molybdenum cofactor guanylyltransferase MobA [unclassified Ectothiorhodospira]|uniref:molybdenum cofactor guanylyltransferase MobA n=1 Tax=unclassified Ectothiorhodospira TaxID=2684909 RepID=UPI001EE991AF|nr:MULTISPECIES: molybdenum cofactor guanylyltransferase MobA [unclassified Ectothiorhodospira]MCG5516076.1 molybdenum cofactor guanylyltransferase [Ectothiorhodospira sp. 9100]MCG5519114.1 molybdenum cofactor guanylyltransferase [Ectothiorhodospira sp. 9905]